MIFQSQRGCEHQRGGSFSTRGGSCDLLWEAKDLKSLETGQLVDLPEHPGGAVVQGPITWQSVNFWYEMGLGAPAGTSSS